MHARVKACAASVNATDISGSASERSANRAEKLSRNLLYFCDFVRIVCQNHTRVLNQMKFESLIHLKELDRWQTGLVSTLILSQQCRVKLL